MNTKTETMDSPNTALARVERDTRRTELGALKFEKNGQLFRPTNGRELMDMASLMAGAGLMVKDIYRGNAGACMGLIAVCAPYGLNPLQVSWKTYQTKQDAPIAYEAQVVVAMINASGALKGSLDYEFRGEGASRQCIVRGTLKGSGDVRELITPRLDQITTKNSPLWKSDPDQQLAYYGGRSWVRRFKPEMLLGIYDVDEMGPIPAGPEHARDVTPRRGGARFREDEPAAAAATIIDSEPAEDETVDPETGEIGGHQMTEEEAERLAAEVRAQTDAVAQQQEGLL